MIHNIRIILGPLWRFLQFVFNNQTIKEYIQAFYVLNSDRWKACFRLCYAIAVLKLKAEMQQVQAQVLWLVDQ